MAVLSQTEFMHLTNVSRETANRYQSYLKLLKKWQQKINLVGNSTLEDPWRRHILDCHQIGQYLPTHPISVVDIGSGAGLPGLILAISTEHKLTLVESDKRKAAFLRFVSSNLNITNIEIINRRAETITATYQVVTARACASIDKILTISQKLATNETQYVLLKGSSAKTELTDCAKHWQIQNDIHVSDADPTGSVVILRGVSSKNESQNRI